jgi:hypothetical protein
MIKRKSHKKTKFIKTGVDQIITIKLISEDNKDFYLFFNELLSNSLYIQNLILISENQYTNVKVFDIPVNLKEWELNLLYKIYKEKNIIFDHLETLSKIWKDTITYLQLKNGSLFSKTTALRIGQIINKQRTLNIQNKETISLLFQDMFEGEIRNSYDVTNNELIILIILFKN